MGYINERTYVRRASDIPVENHFAVIESDSRYIEGDQRSRDYPGHGYPASTEQFVQYIAFKSEDAVKEYIRAAKTDYRVLKITPVIVSTSVILELL